MAKATTADLLNALKFEAQDAFVLLKTIDSLCGTPGKARLLNSIAPQFFVIAKDAMIDALILSISKLTDKPSRDESVTIERLAELAFSPPSSPEFADLQKSIERLKKIIEPIRSHRNKRVAHLDEHYSIGAKALPDVAESTFREAAKLIQKIINSIQEKLGECPTAFDAIWIQTGSDLLLHKLVWARRWEMQEQGKCHDSRLPVTADEIENTDWTAWPGDAPEESR